MRLGKVHIWVVPLCYVVDLLIPKNRVFGLRNVQIWVMLFWKEVVLLIFSNFVSKLQNVQICNMSCLRNRIPESFISSKLSNMDCVDVERGLLTNCLEWHFHAAER